jgi:hypothetical protein
MSWSISLEDPSPGILLLQSLQWMMMTQVFQDCFERCVRVHLDESEFGICSTFSTDPNDDAHDERMVGSGVLDAIGMPDQLFNTVFLFSSVARRGLWLFLQLSKFGVQASNFRLLLGNLCLLLGNFCVLLVDYLISDSK